MGDQGIELDLAIHIPVDELVKLTETSAAHVATAQAPTQHQMGGSAAGDGAMRYDADDVTLSPRGMCAFERLSHRLWVADAFEAVISAATRELHQMARQLRY